MFALRPKQEESIEVYHFFVIEVAITIVMTLFNEQTQASHVTELPLLMANTHLVNRSVPRKNVKFLYIDLVFERSMITWRESGQTPTSIVPSRFLADTGTVCAQTVHSKVARLIFCWSV